MISTRRSTLRSTSCYRLRLSTLYLAKIPWKYNTLASGFPCESARTYRSIFRRVVRERLAPSLDVAFDGVPPREGLAEGARPERAVEEDEDYRSKLSLRQLEELYENFFMMEVMGDSELKSVFEAWELARALKIEQHLREQWAGLKTEAGLRRIEHVQACEIRRQQITGKTHPLESEGKGPGQRFSQSRFPHPRAVFYQQMTAGQQTTEGQAHLMAFAQQHTADSLDQWQQLWCSQGITPSTAPS